MKDVLVTIVSKKGTCRDGHKVGETFRCGGKTPTGMCAMAYAVLYPTVRAMSYGASFPWAAPDGSLDLACPDVLNPVVFRLKAVD